MYRPRVKAWLHELQSQFRKPNVRPDLFEPLRFEECKPEKELSAHIKSHAYRCFKDKTPGFNCDASPIHLALQILVQKANQTCVVQKHQADEYQPGDSKAKVN